MQPENFRENRKKMDSYMDIKRYFIFLECMMRKEG